MNPRILTLAALLPTALAADTIRLKDGTELEGKLLRTEGDEQVFQVQVTASIRDERRIPKRDILEIVAEKQDSAAFEEIDTLVPTPDLLETSDYDDRISKVESFLKEFPKSSSADEAGEMLETLKEERAVVANGGVKFEGKLIDAADRKARAYPLDARIAANKVLRHGDARDYVGALRAWEKLQAEYSASSAYLDTVPYITSLMRTQLKAVTASLATLDDRVAEREANLAALPANDRSRTERLLAEENTAYERRLNAEKEAQIEWLTLSPWHEDALKATERRLEQSIKKLENLDESRLADGDTLWSDAWTAVTQGTEEERDATKKTVDAVKRARLPDRYVGMLEERLPEK